MREHRPAPSWVVALDVIATIMLLVIVLRLTPDPAWGNLEGKAPGTRW